MSRLLNRLKEGLIVADGAMGTMLAEAGLPTGQAPESWNVESPESVRAIHRAYIEAGAEIVLTNTFGGSRLKLERSGLADRVAELNAAAIHVAREAGDALVAASIGPTGHFVEPLGEISREEMEAVFAEQIDACREADIIWIETMTDLDEARAAVDAARRVTDLPVSVTLTYDEGPRGPRTMMGVSPTDAANALGDAVDLLGVNCTTPENALAVVREYREALPEMPLVARPNAGRPILKNHRTVFPMEPEPFRDAVAELARHVAVLGGCCGTTPEHIRELVAAFR